MTTPGNPGWPTGYIPTAGEWAAAFSGKVDYPAPIDQGGTGAQNADDAAYNLARRALISATPTQLLPFYSYGLKTGTAALMLDLPPLSTVGAGDWIDVYDVDYNAATNNVTLVGYNTETITLYGTASNTQTLNVSGVRARLVVNGATWSMIV